VRAVTAAAWLLTLAYPFVVWFGIGRWDLRWLAGALLLIAVARALGTRDRRWWIAAAGTASLVVASVLADDALPLKLYPVLVNAVLLGVFGLSLRFPPSLIERLARLHEPDLPPSGVAYTRTVTKVWCAFFVGNGTLALASALWASDKAWALYNGLVAYLLMGALFAGEWLVRGRVRARAAASEKIATGARAVDADG
jgi:uncharacterized membrane protein